MSHGMKTESSYGLDEAAYLGQCPLRDAVDREDNRIPEEPRECPLEEIGEVFFVPPALRFPHATEVRQPLVKVLLDTVREVPKLLKLFCRGLLRGRLPFSRSPQPCRHLVTSPSRLPSRSSSARFLSRDRPGA